ncbi:MAG TPA: MerR family transcriptional regulator [Chitinophagaceae bacterium]|jgi:Predicted transcriptional regulators
MSKPFTQITFDFSSATEAKESDVEIQQEEKDIEVAEVSQENAATPLLVSKKNTKTTNRGRRSLKEIDINADLINIPPDEILFQKQYYAIGQVAKMFRVNQSLLRFWEGEFDILKPKKNGKGDRFFRAQDVKHLQLIYDLLRRRKFTIEGAKDYIKNNKQTQDNFAMIQSLEKIRSFLLELKASL